MLWHIYDFIFLEHPIHTDYLTLPCCKILINHDFAFLSFIGTLVFYGVFFNKSTLV